jgi:hypothetical protein
MALFMYTTVWNFNLFYNNYCILFTFIRNLNWIFFVQKLHCKMTAKDPYKCCPPQFMWKWFGQRSHTRQQSGGEHGCQIFPCTYNVPKREKIYQMTTNVPNVYMKYIPNGRQILQMAIKFTNIFHSKALQNILKLEFLVWKYTPRYAMRCLGIEFIPR